MTGESFRKAGFWVQLLLLGLVDWATVLAFIKQDVAWYHYMGFVVVNFLVDFLYSWLDPRVRAT